MARVEQTTLQFKVEINGETVKAQKSIKDLKKDYRDLRQKLETIPQESQKYNDKLKELAKVDAALTAHRKNIRGISDGFVKNTEGASKFTGVLKKVGSSISSAFGPATLILGAVSYLVGITKAAFDAAIEMGKLQEKTNQVTGLIGEDLKNATATASALGKTFEIDVPKGIDAANAAANAYIKPGQEIGDVYTSALDKIGDRLLALPGKGDEFLDQITEYSGKAKDAGLSMDRFFNLVATGINRGVPTDKLIDSVKEFDLRIKNISKGQREVLEKTFGTEFTDKIVKGVEEGKITSIEALDQIGGGIKELGETSAASQKVITELFGGPGEDATAKYITLISGVSEELGSVVDTSNVYIQRKQRLLELEKQSALATAELSFQIQGGNQLFQEAGLILKTDFINGLSKVLEVIQYFPEYFSAATSSWQAFGNVIISGIEFIFRKMTGLGFIIEKIFDVKLELPRFETDGDPYAEVEAKIDADRKAFEERQRQKVLEEQGKTDAAKRLQSLQAERERQKQLQNLTRSEQEKLAQIELEAAKKIEDLKIALMEDGLEKQIAAAKLAAQREIESVKGSKEQIAVQEQLIYKKLQKQIESLRAADRDKRKKDEEKALSDEAKSRAASYNRRVDALKKAHEKEILLITQKALSDIESGMSVADADVLLKERMLASAKEFLEKRKQLEEEFGVDDPATSQESVDDELAKFRAKEEEKLRIRKENWDKTISIAENASSIINSFSDLIAANNQRRFDAEIANIQAQEAAALKAAGDNEAKKARIRENFEKQTQRVREQQAKAQQRTAISRAVIDGALAVMRIAADVPKADFGITTALMIAAQVAATAAQIGVIKSQTFAKGGRLPLNLFGRSDRGPQPGKGGMPKGPSHKEGHIFLIDGRSGNIAGAIEGGEPILSTETYRNNPYLVDKLLDSSMNRGGKNIEDELRDYFFLNKPIPEVLRINTTPAQANITYQKGGILPRLSSVPVWQDGGLLVDGPSTTPSQAVVESTTAPGVDLGIREDLKALIEVTRNNRFIMIGEQDAESLARMMDVMAKEKSNRTLD